MKRISFFSVLVLEGLVGLHRTIQLQLLQHYWLGHWLGFQFQFSHSVVSDSLWPMNCSMPGFPVLLPELAQIHVHWVGDAIQPSHPLSSPFLPAFNLSQHQGLSNESTLRMRWPKYWSFSFSIGPSNEHPGLISFRMDWLDLLVVQGTLKSLLQHHSPKASIFLELSFLHCPTLTSIHDHWKNHSFD